MHKNARTPRHAPIHQDDSDFLLAELLQQQTKVPHPHTTSQVQFLLGEYTALREELMKRTEMQFQLKSLAIIVAGTIITFGVPQSGSANFNLTLALLAYPIFAAFLAVHWSEHDVRNRQIGVYIKEVIEKHLVEEGFGWEHRKVGRGEIMGITSYTVFVARGLFLSCQVLMIGLFVYVSGNLLPRSYPEALLYLLDILAITLTVYILRAHPVRIKSSERQILSSH